MNQICEPTDFTALEPKPQTEIERKTLTINLADYFCAPRAQRLEDNLCVLDEFQYFDSS